MTRCRLLIFVVTFCLSTLAFAKAAPDRTQMGREIHVAPGENTGDVTCIGCSIYIRGHVNGDATTVGGSIVLEEGASVTGDVTAVGGGIRVQAGSSVAGDVTAIGRDVRRDSQANIGGDVTSLGGIGWLIGIFLVPVIFLAAVVALIVWLVRRGSQNGVATYAPAPNTRV